MGATSQNETKYLYKVTTNGLIRTSIYAKFETNYFAEGAFRYCFKGTLKNINGNSVRTLDFPSGICVVKVYKNKENMQDYSLDFLGSQYAYEQAILFNSIIKIPNKFNFVLPYAGSIHLLAGFKLFGLFKVSTNDQAKKYLEKDMLVAIEPFLSGTYTKFSSNTGYENPDFDAYIPAFSHFTWIYSKGRKVVTDVQGVFKNQRYYLTDPACQSIEGKFGNSDLGAMGLFKFILCHRHNDICKNWIWIPKNLEGILRQYNANSIKRTSFKFEHWKNIQTYTPIYLQLLNLIKFN